MRLFCDELKYSWLKPLEGSSWISYDTMFLNWWLCHWKQAILVIVIIFAIVVTILVLWYFNIL